MRHVIAARVLQDTPPPRAGGRNRGVPRSESAWGWDVGGGGKEVEGLDLLAGMDSNDTDYRKVCIHESCLMAMAMAMVMSVIQSNQSLCVYGNLVIPGMYSRVVPTFYLTICMGENV